MIDTGRTAFLRLRAWLGRPGGPAVLFVVLLCIVAPPVLWAAEDLYVFLPTSPSRPPVLQESIEKACPSWRVTAFGRQQDLEERVSVAPPAAILSAPIVLENHEGYRTVLKGQRDGATTEEYSVVSLDTPVSVSSLARASIGVIDLLGRTGMKAMVADALSITPHLRRVTNPADLLPLLSFNMVQAVLIPHRLVEPIGRTSNQTLRVTPVPNVRFGIAAVAVAGNAPPSSLKSLKELTAMDSKVLALLDIQGWVPAAGARK